MVGEREENLKKKHIYTKKTAEAVFFVCRLKSFRRLCRLFHRFAVSTFQGLKQEPQARETLKLFLQPEGLSF